MFEKSIDDRLSSWAQHRRELETSASPLEDVWDFWCNAPYIPYNNKIDPYYTASWPSPWEIIVENKYDDFTKAIMIGNTLKLTNRYCNSVIQLRTYVDKLKNKLYNVVIIDETWLINYNDNGPVLIENLPESFLLENLIELESTR
jgi:hypothetical protein